MNETPSPAHEADETVPASVRDPARLSALRETALLDSPAEEDFDRLTRLAVRIMDTEVALVSLVDEDRQFFQSSVGLNEPWRSERESPLSHSYCMYAVDTGEPFLVEDASSHLMLAGNPAISELGCVAYAGIPLMTEDGYALGTLCVFQSSPRQWRPEEIEILKDLAGAVMTAIELRVELRERRRDEAALRKRYLRSHVERASELITVLDAEGTILWTSPSWERILGYEPGAIRGRNVFEVVHPDDQERITGRFGEFLDQPEHPEIVEFRFRHADGSWRLLRGIGNNLLGDPEVRGVVINSRDITDERALEDQLRQAQKLEALGSLAGSVAHDFNNVLAVIGGTVELMIPGVGEDVEPEVLRQDLEEIRAAAERGAALTRQLLMFSRKESLAVGPLNLNEVIREIEPMLMRLLGSSIELRTELAAGVGEVMADAGQMDQILMNLIANARDAVPAGGRVVIRTGEVKVEEDAAMARLPGVEGGDYVLLEVEDTGPGMPSDVLEKIFDPFFTTKEEGKGTGLGLSTVYGIVHQSGGHITVGSEVGKGTTFRVLLPLSRP